MHNELRKRYLKLRRSRSMGKIDNEKFLAEVHKLRFKDESEVWWQIDAETGDWVKWNGQDWQPANIENAKVKGSEQKAEKNSGPTKNRLPSGESEAKGTAAELSGIISISFSSFIKQTFRGLFRRARMMIIFGIIAFLFHTFLLAVGNNGYDKDSNISSMFRKLRSYSPKLFSGNLPWLIKYTVGDFKVGSNIAIDDNEVPATAGWLLGGAMLLMGWRGFRRFGLFGGMGRLLAMPKRIASMCGPNTWMNLGGLAIGAIFASYFSDWLPHQSQNMLSFISLGMMGSMLPLVLGSLLSRIANQIFRHFKTKMLKKIGFASLAQMLFMGFTCGMFANSVWKYGTYVGIALAVYTIFLVITRPSAKAMPLSPKVSQFFAIVSVFGLISALSEDSLFAHDKGWWENVNTNDSLKDQIVSWVKAPGSTEIMKAGVPPSIGAAVGAGAADAASDTTTYVLQVNTHYIEARPDNEEELLVAVWKSEDGGALVPAGDASISISGTAPWLTLSQTSGVCRVNCLVGQTAESVQSSVVPESVILSVTGAGGGQTCTSTVTVAPGGMPQYVLEVF
jgi:hypothetical protein